MILQCPRCNHIREWNNELVPQGPGNCSCGAWASWKVLKEMPKIFKGGGKGFVRVISDKGWQELHGTDWQEEPNGWKNTKDWKE
jgi:hypothetical protein